MRLQAVKEAEGRREAEEKAANTIQNTFKKYLLRKDTIELKSSEAPSLRLVRKFVTYLQDKDYDITDQLDIEKSKARVTHLVVANQRLDRDLSELDEKIGLVVRNRINLQDVIADKNKISEEAAKQNREETCKSTAS